MIMKIDLTPVWLEAVDRRWVSCRAGGGWCYRLLRDGVPSGWHASY